MKIHSYLFFVWALVGVFSSAALAADEYLTLSLNSPQAGSSLKIEQVKIQSAVGPISSSQLEKAVAGTLMELTRLRTSHLSAVYSHTEERIPGSSLAAIEKIETYLDLLEQDLDLLNRLKIKHSFGGSGVESSGSWIFDLKHIRHLEQIELLKKLHIFSDGQLSSYIRPILRNQLGSLTGRKVALNLEQFVIVAQIKDSVTGTHYETTAQVSLPEIKQGLFSRLFGREESADSSVTVKSTGEGAIEFKVRRSNASGLSAREIAVLSQNIKGQCQDHLVLH